MDTEFINTYIAKQKAQIDDLQTRLLLSDTKLQIVESRYNTTLEKLKKCEEELEQLELLNTPQPDVVELEEVDTKSELDS